MNFGGGLPLEGAFKIPYSAAAFSSIGKLFPNPGRVR
jgi:hypothetical protein